MTTGLTGELGFGILVSPLHGKDVPVSQHIAEHTELVRAADDLGFDLMIAGQHYLGDSMRYLQPIPYLAHLSTVAPSMRVATGIILLSMANPVDLAEQMATLDSLTGGRAVLGVGLGYSAHEFDAFGVEKGTKVARFEEALRLIRQLWSGDQVNFDGRFWSVHDATTATLPVQRPGLPIWLGGQATAAIRRAARITDAWYAPPFPSHTELLELRRIFVEERERCGLSTDGEWPVRREMVIAESRAAALRLAQDWSERRYKTYARWGLSGENTAAAGISAGSTKDIEEHFILGTPDECADELGRLAENGMTHFVYKPTWQGLPHVHVMRQLELFGSKVLPQLRSGTRPVAISAS